MSALRVMAGAPILVLTLLVRSNVAASLDSNWMGPIGCAQVWSELKVQYSASSTLVIMIILQFSVCISIFMEFLLLRICCRY